jgi:hypothetical protein
MKTRGSRVKTRSLVALAATTIVAAAFTPLTANAATITAHSSSISGVHSSAIRNLINSAKAKPAVAHAVTTGPVTANLTAGINGALTVLADASASSTSASGATITSVSFTYGDGTAATTSTTHTYATAGTYTITATVTDSAANSATTSVSFTTLGSDYTAYGPTRILDTRSGTGTNGTTAKVGAGATLKLKVAGAGTSGNTIPSGVTAVVMTLTVTNPTSAGFITAYDDGEATAPTTSNVNYAPGETVPNLVIVPVGSDGYVDLYNASKGSTDLVADVSGYFTPTAGSQYVAIPDYRLLDTRSGAGQSGNAAKAASDGTLTVTVAGADNGTLPSGITAVELNLTVTNPTQNGFLTAYPSGSGLPNSSNVNFGKGETVPDAVIVPVGSDGKIKIYNASKGTTDIIADVSGYFTTSSSVTTSAFVPLPPTRVLDTRSTTLWDGTPLAKNSAYWVSADPAGMGISSVVVNATVTNPQTNGFVTLFPYNDASSAIPTASNVNYGHNETVANLAIASLGTTADAYGGVDLGIANTSNGSTDFILDQTGLFASQ